MKNNHIKLYPLKVLLAFVFVFCLLGTELLLSVKHIALNPATFETVTETQQLDEKAYTTLESYFRSRANSTGIPAEVFLNPITKEQLRQGTLDSVSGALAYLKHTSDSYEFRMDFKELETSITEFFENYAEENHFQKDEIYQQKITSTIAEAEKEILFIADTFKFSTIHENGWLEKARHYIPALDRFIMIALGLTILTGVLLMLVCLKNIREFPYWFGISGMTSGILLTAPCGYLKATDYISGFIIKDPQIFAAVVGYLNTMLNHELLQGILTTAAGLLLLILFAVLSKKIKN
ncbi:MAG: hypothetical protein K2H82_07005 [Oscillospiraceae bacterium]|nr:hypothetical protein [Oscillospiraceae bacterium]